jgi:predicted nucleic acid-binding protein
MRQNNRVDTLTDTGPLVALLDSRDKHHGACVEVVKTLPKPLVTMWPCITESMYLLGRSRGHAAQDALWAMIDTGFVVIYELSATDRVRMRVLMAQYADRPMDLADASLVAAAETIGVKRVFTVDSDFLFYRLAGGTTLRTVP